MNTQETLAGDECIYPESELRYTAAPVHGQVALYRFYDAHEELLYVGISNDPRRRWKEHAKDKTWYPRVRHQALTWYPGEYDARRAETRAIREERPQFNVVGAIRPVRSRFTIRPHRWVAAACVPGYMAMGLGCVMGFARPTPFLQSVLPPCIIAACLLLVVSLTGATAVVCAPFIRRFGSWIERNSITYPGAGAL